MSLLTGVFQSAELEKKYTKLTAQLASLETKRDNLYNIAVSLEAQAEAFEREVAEYSLGTGEDV
jgi:hypothetical protein